MSESKIYNNKEKCELCRKFVYTHDIILVCSNDHKPYHAKCLKISSDTAIEVQKLPDWICPRCLKDIIPFLKQLIIVLNLLTVTAVKNY